MKLHIINSNSAGNCYILTDNNKQSLIIEAGVDFKKIKKSLDFDFSNVVGCLITHEHKDHSKAVWNIINAGIETYSGIKTHIAMGTERSHRAKVLKENAIFNIGPYKVKCFNVQHDAVEPLGFIIYHNEMGVCLFATDTYYLTNTFNNLNQVIIECNYAGDILENKTLPSFLENRIIQSHMSLEQCKATLKANDLSDVKNIVLIHLSNSNADGQRFKKEIQALTGTHVHIAKPEMTIDNFDINPF